MWLKILYILSDIAALYQPHLVGGSVCNTTLDWSRFFTAPTHIRLAAIIVVIQTLGIFSSRREPHCVVIINKEN